MAMLSSPLELVRQELESDYALVSDQYAAASRQLRTTTNESDKPVLQAQIDGFKAEMERLWNEIQEIEQSSPGLDVKQRQQQWEDALPQIDFQEAWLDFQRLYTQHIHREEGGGALIMVSHFRTMSADLLLRRMVAWLKETVGYGKVRPAMVGICEQSQLTPAMFLGRLGSAFDLPFDVGIQDGTARRAHTRRLAEKMCDALGPGELLFIEMTVDTDLYAHEDFLLWLLDEFWVVLLDSLHASASKHAFLKCLLYISVTPPAPRKLPLRERYCPPRRYQPSARQIARLPLSPWSEEDIKAWLVTYSGLAGEWDRQMLNEQARSIFRASDNGVPILALHKMNELFSQRWTA